MSGETERDVSGWTVDQLREHYNALRAADARFAEERYARQEEARALQAVEYERRLQALNHENERIAEILGASVTADKFEDYQKSQATALALALQAKDDRLQRQDDRISALENWRSKALGAGVIGLAIASVLGAAVFKVFAG